MTQGVIKNKIFIPEEDTTEECLKDAYEVDVFNEQACIRCPYKNDRPNMYCQACGAYNGLLRLWGRITVNGKNYYTIPAGNIKRASKYTGIDFSTYKDLRCQTRFSNPLKWTGKLRHGEVINDVQSANQEEIVEKWLSEDKRYGFIQAPPRTGKCVTGETLINLSSGFIHFDELDFKDGFSDFKEEISTLSGLDLTSKSFKSKAKTLKIITQDGYEISGTYEHPLLVINPDLTFSWKCLQDIEIGDYIVSSPNESKVLFGNSKVTKEEARLLGWFIATEEKMVGALVI